MALYPAFKGKWQMESKRSCRKKHGYCEMNEDYPACPVLGAGKVPEAKE
jgi:hypothetical protein